MVISTDNDRLTIIISKKSKKKLQQLAKEDNRSLSNYVANILENYIAGEVTVNQKERQE